MPQLLFLLPLPQIKSVNIMQTDKDDPTEDAPEEEVAELMESHDLDKDTAERVQEIMEDLGVDEDDAVEIEESL